MKKQKNWPLISTITLIVSWILLFLINIPDDFENNALVLIGFSLVIAATIFFIITLIKMEKKDVNNVKTENKTDKKIALNTIFENKTKEEILQLTYQKYEEFIEKYRVFFVFFSDYSDLCKEAIEDKKIEYIQEAENEFFTSLFIHILINSNPDDKKKTVKFLKNIDANIIEELKDEYDLDKTKLQKMLDNSIKSLISVDFNKWKKSIFNNLALMHGSDWPLTEEVFIEFMTYIEDAYNAYVIPTIPIEILGDYKKSSTENAKSASNKNIYMFYLPLGLAIAMVVLFIMQIMNDGGFILDGGWWSFGIFVVLVIWCSIGWDGKQNTCSRCKKWDSLKLITDVIVDSKDTWKTVTKTADNGKTYSEQVAIRVERHKQTYKCEHCGEIEIKYLDREYKLLITPGEAKKSYVILTNIISKYENVIKEELKIFLSNLPKEANVDLDRLKFLLGRHDDVTMSNPTKDIHILKSYIEFALQNEDNKDIYIKHLNNILSYLCKNNEIVENIINTYKEYSGFKIIEKTRNEEYMDKKLNNLVGLNNIKLQLKELKDWAYVTKLRKEKGLKTSSITMHMVFTGSPGTGKTTVARIIADIYYNLGIIKENKLIEVSREDLVAEYLGQSEIKTKKVLENAKGGVLFIDEAYSLTENNDQYGNDVVNTILKFMEDHREDTVIIIAGYPNEIEQFINSNPGLKSRFNTYLKFENYSYDELLEILKIMVKSNDYNISKEDLNKILKELKKIDITDITFSNARYIRNLFENAIKKQATRLAHKSNLNKQDLETLIYSDFF